MKKLGVCFFIVLIVFSTIACAKTVDVTQITGEFSANNMEIKTYKSIEKIKEDKAATSEAEDSIKLKEVKKVLQFSQLPTGVEFDNYTISEEYIVSYYSFDNPDQNLMSMAGADPVIEEGLTTINLTNYRTLGQEAFDIFVEENKNSGDMVAFGDVADIFMVAANYQDTQIALTYYFVFKGEYMTLSVPGNFSQEQVGNLLEYIEQIDIK